MLCKEYKNLYQNKELPYKAWLSADSQSVETILFLGMVQVGELAQQVASTCPPGTLVIEGVSHWQVDDVGAAMPDLLLCHTRHAFDSIIAEYNLAKVNIIAESQAAPAIVRLLTEDKYRFFMKRLILLQPLGLNSNNFVGTDNQKLAEFKKRVLSNARHHLTDILLNKPTHYGLKLLSKYGDPFKSQSVELYASGLKHDSMSDLKQLYDGGNSDIVIICGANDMMFHPDEIKANLSKADLPIEVITVKDASHTTLAAPKGQLLLDRAFSLISSQLASVID